MEIEYFDLSQATEEEIWAIWRGELHVQMTPEDEAMFYEYCGREIYAEHLREYPNATSHTEIYRVLPEDDPLGEGYFVEVTRTIYDAEAEEPEFDDDNRYHEIMAETYEKRLLARTHQDTGHYSKWWGVLNWFEGDQFYSAESLKEDDSALNWWEEPTPSHYKHLPV